MFINKKEYDELVAQNEQLTSEVTRIQGLVNAATARVTELETRNSELTTEAETLRTAQTDLQAQLETANATVKSLTEENETLRNLPGANSQDPPSETEHNHGESKTELEKLNEFCAKNADNPSACMQAINAYYSNSK